MLSTTNNSNNHHNNHNNKPRSTVPGVHSSAWNPERHRFQTKASLALTAVTLLLFCVLSVVFHERDDRQHQSSWMQQQKQQPSSSSFLAFQQQQQQQQQQHPHQQHRWLNDQEEEENNDNDNNNDNNNNDDDNDYSSYSCNHLYSIVPDRGEAQCQFAKTCNQGVGVWMTAVFCNFHLKFATWMMILAPLILLWMIVLFRLLGSTAEDYFSPALEMLAVKLGLPPRFAGVTLLALGNGAADVSATVSAITNDPQNGYLLSLGALTGAAMVISSVVSALVVLVAGGVPCRGALVRDVTALGVSVLIVWGQLGGGGNKDGGGGKVGPETVTLFLSLYAVFVLLVLCADVYHRAVVLPRRTLRAQEAERQRQLREQELHQEHVLAATAASNGNNALSAISETPDRDSPTQGQAVPMLSPPQAQQAQDGGGSPRRNNARFSTVLTAFSNYDNDNPGGEGWGGNGGGGILTGVSGGGVDSEELMTGDRPILLHGSHGILNQKTPTPLLNDNAQQQEQEENQETAYRIMEDAGMMVLTDQTCVETGAANRTWSTAWTAARTEVRQHANQVWDDICYNGDIDVATKFLLICEVPFIVARKITVPIPCEGYYVRGLIALSLALSPLWMAFYIWNGYDVILFGSIVFWCYWGVVLVAALCLLRFAPAGGGNDNATTNGTAAAAVEGELSLWVATPVALYGFCVAATWIDIVADALVSLLDFVGIVLRIPGPVVGLTILAWGNSMSDLSANITMARKGLANMAMTACFAGPFFNILVGLGLGFSRLAAQTGQAERTVQLQPSISVGFWFLAVNSVAILVTGLMLGRGRVPKKYGYIALTIYSIYLCVSLLMEYKF